MGYRLTENLKMYGGNTYLHMQSDKISQSPELS